MAVIYRPKFKTVLVFCADTVLRPDEKLSKIRHPDGHERRNAPVRRVWLFDGTGASSRRPMHVPQLSWPLLLLLK
jgi:hypothetical protein